MPIEVNGIKLYSSSEVAEIFNISVNTVRSWKLNHRIKGQKIGSATYYTEEQIKAARTEEKTRGPKPKKNVSTEGKEGRNNSGTYLGRNFAVAV